MKKYLFALLFVLTAQCFAANIHITANRDNTGAIMDYTVTTWNGKDGAQVDTKYTIAEAQTKFGKLLDNTEVGTSASPDRITLIFNDDGTLHKVDAQVTSRKTYDIVEGKIQNEQVTGQLEVKQKTAGDLSANVQTDALATKTDIETKIGKPIDGKDPVPPDEGEPVEPEP